MAARSALRKKSSANALRRQFFDRAVQTILSFGATELEREEPDGLNGPSARFELGSKCGLLHVTVYDDWVHTRFDAPQRVVEAGVLSLLEFNRHSGKWNHHISDIESCDEAELDSYFIRLTADLARVGAAPFPRREEVLALDQAEALDPDELQARLSQKTDGVTYRVEGLDREALVDRLCGMLSDAAADQNRFWFQRHDDLALLAELRRIEAEHAPAPAP